MLRTLFVVARFANWLHNGQRTGPQNASTTEDGAYALNGAITDAALLAVSRNSGATWFIPSENEWYKAAYHQPAAQGGDADNYWAYPTRTNNTPYSDQPPGGGAPVQSNTANFRQDDGFANGYDDGYAVTGSPTLSNTQNYLTDMGAYTSATSPYGTYDQGGNVYEWTEVLISRDYRGSRGGPWKLDDYTLRADLSRAIGYPSVGTNLVGFRVAYIPEPSTLALGLLGALGAYFFARRRRPK